MIEEEGTQPAGLSPIQKVTKTFAKNVVIGVVVLVAVAAVIVALR